MMLRRCFGRVSDRSRLANAVSWVGDDHGSNFMTSMLEFYSGMRCVKPTWRKEGASQNSGFGCSFLSHEASVGCARCFRSRFWQVASRRQQLVCAWEQTNVSRSHTNDGQRRSSKSCSQEVKKVATSKMRNPSMNSRLIHALRTQHSDDCSCDFHGMTFAFSWIATANSMT